MPITFSDYLQAKYALDSRSLNRDVLQLLLADLKSRHKLRWLDLGTGTGAMIRRLIDCNIADSLDIVGVDTDRELLLSAKTILKNHLTNQGYAVEDRQPSLVARRAGQSLRIRFECFSLLNPNPAIAASGYDLVTAHAVMDIVPLDAAVQQIMKVLDERGYFYATLNYDGDTSLIPTYSDQTLERRILAI